MPRRSVHWESVLIATPSSRASKTETWLLLKHPSRIHHCFHPEVNFAPDTHAQQLYQCCTKQLIPTAKAWRSSQLVRDGPCATRTFFWQRRPAPRRFADQLLFPKTEFGTASDSLWLSDLNCTGATRRLSVPSRERESKSGLRGEMSSRHGTTRARARPALPATLACPCSPPITVGARRADRSFGLQPSKPWVRSPDHQPCVPPTRPSTSLRELRLKSSTTCFLPPSRTSCVTS